jgi:hypothetical protein
MPISIAGSGTITGISVGGIPDGVVDTDVLAANAVTTAKLGSAEASGLAKAWVNFNGTGTVAIRASYNVSSITDNGTGDYTVNFTTAMTDANYSITGMVSSEGESTTEKSDIRIKQANLPTTTAVRIQNEGRFGLYDASFVTVAIFR